MAHVWPRDRAIHVAETSALQQPSTTLSEEVGLTRSAVMLKLLQHESRQEWTEATGVGSGKRRVSRGDRSGRCSQECRLLEVLGSMNVDLTAMHHEQCASPTNRFAQGDPGIRSIAQARRVVSRQEVI